MSSYYVRTLTPKSSVYIFNDLWIKVLFEHVFIEYDSQMLGGDTSWITSLYSWKILRNWMIDNKKILLCLYFIFNEQCSQMLYTSVNWTVEKTVSDTGRLTMDAWVDHFKGWISNLLVSNPTLPSSAYMHLAIHSFGLLTALFTCEPHKWEYLPTYMNYLKRDFATLACLF